MEFLDNSFDFEKRALDLIDSATKQAVRYHNEYLTPEHILLAMTMQKEFLAAADFGNNINVGKLRASLEKYIEEDKENILPDTSEEESYILLSEQSNKVVRYAASVVAYSSAEKITVPHILNGILSLPESRAGWFFHMYLNKEVGEAEFLSQMIRAYGVEDSRSVNDGMEEDEPDFDALSDEPDGEGDPSDESRGHKSWHDMVTCISELVKDKKTNPLIGRKQELDRTIQILCRKDKNNVLHVGEPGVGKTALVYGLATMINEGNVPDRLKDFKIYEVNMANMVAGTQFRGQFEKRIKSIMDGICQEGKCIVYIDEIHNIVGAGKTEGSMDASNMLKPYLVRNEIRFMGSTTYEEFNRYLMNDKALMRRFQQVDILEPTVEDAVTILEGLKNKYEEYHHVQYEEGTITYAVEASAKYITDRFLPDKAIDLIDEAGAYRELHPSDSDPQTVDKTLLSDVLCKICKVDSLSMKEDSSEMMENLESRVLSKIYGQDMAVRQVIEAVQMAKAGLQEEDKPMASLLFVGPTGVGKTELCRVLAAELGISLVRFDMSEYAEKHAVAKLIGSPAGYVGYEDGGLLTDAIRKTPNCVLLLDEIEKAHSDIYNILLQVMDYAKLTDNKGRKADFRHVILVMTSNAGAQYAHLSSIGFGSQVTAGNAMLTQVKKLFKPEFLNRLNGTVVFNDMDEHMAELILNKKVSALETKLKAKNVTLDLSVEAKAFLLKKGYSKEYGAREMDRAIRANLTTLLTKSILFGALKNGGVAHVEVDGDTLVIR